MACRSNLEDPIRKHIINRIFLQIMKLVIACFRIKILYYLDKSNVLQYFGNVRNNFPTPNIFADVIKVNNLTKLWHAELTWYSPIATHWIRLYGLEYSLRVHAIRPTCHCLIIKVLRFRGIFPEPSGYGTEINCAFIFCTTNVFGGFRCVMA